MMLNEEQQQEILRRLEEARLNQPYVNGAPRRGPYASDNLIASLPSFEIPEGPSPNPVEKLRAYKEKNKKSYLPAAEASTPSESPRAEVLAPLMAALSDKKVVAEVPGPGPYRLPEGSYRMPWEMTQAELDARPENLPHFERAARRASSKGSGKVNELTPEGKEAAASGKSSFLEQIIQGMGNVESQKEIDLPKRTIRNMDLRPLLGLVDAWTGSRMSSGYEDPLAREEAQRSKAAELAYTKDRAKTERMKAIGDLIDKEEDRKIQKQRADSESALSAAKAKRYATMGTGAPKKKEISEDRHIELEGKFRKTYDTDIQKITAANAASGDSAEVVASQLYNQARRLSESQGIPLSEALQATVKASLAKLQGT